MVTEPLQITIDTREQHPYLFLPQVGAELAVLSVKGLKSGDYSLAGAEDRVAVERKSLDDFVSCCGRERDRFERELERLATMAAAAVVVEADYGAISAGRYRSRIKAEAVLGSVAAWTVRYRIPFLLCGDRAGGEAMTWRLLRQFARQLVESPKIVGLAV